MHSVTEIHRIAALVIVAIFHAAAALIHHFVACFPAVTCIAMMAGALFG